jgi:ADP-ribosylglycohydrolase
MEYAERSSRLTHSAPEAVDACRYFAALLFGAVKGEDRATLLAPHYSPLADYWARKPLCSAVDAIAAGSYKSKTRAQIESTSYAVHTLESALWAFHNTQDFSAGALEAVNLAGDADATGAVFGALAGAYYGEMQLPYAWVRWLSYVQGFYHFAQELLALSASTRGPASTDQR